MRKKVNKYLCRISNILLKRPPELFYKINVLKFCNIHRKTPVLKSLCGPSGLQFYEKETPVLMFSFEYCEIFKNTSFEEHLRTTNRHSWRLNKSSKKKTNNGNLWILKKNLKKMHVNLIKYQVENCPVMPGRNLISTCNCSVKSVSAERVEISSRQAGIM